MTASGLFFKIFSILVTIAGVINTESAEPAISVSIEQDELVTEIDRTDEKVTSFIDEPIEPTKAPSNTGLDPEIDTAPTFHIVQVGENLYRISLMYNIKIQRLAEWNNLSDESVISQGKKIWLVPQR